MSDDSTERLIDGTHRAVLEPLLWISHIVCSFDDGLEVTSIHEWYSNDHDSSRQIVWIIVTLTELSTSDTNKNGHLTFSASLTMPVHDLLEVDCLLGLILHRLRECNAFSAALPDLPAPRQHAVAWEEDEDTSSRQIRRDVLNEAAQVQEHILVITAAIVEDKRLSLIGLDYA